MNAKPTCDLNLRYLRQAIDKLDLGSSPKKTFIARANSSYGGHGRLSETNYHSIFVCRKVFSKYLEGKAFPVKHETVLGVAYALGDIDPIKIIEPTDEDGLKTFEFEFERILGIIKKRRNEDPSATKKAEAEAYFNDYPSQLKPFVLRLLEFSTINFPLNKQFIEIVKSARDIDSINISKSEIALKIENSLIKIRYREEDVRSTRDADAITAKSLPYYLAGEREFPDEVSLEELMLISYYLDLPVSKFVDKGSPHRDQLARIENTPH
ncbi:MAG: hypothetical protein ACPGN3_15980 [Opitutales bacterium]